MQRGGDRGRGRGNPERGRGYRGGAPPGGRGAPRGGTAPGGRGRGGAFVPREQGGYVPRLHVPHSCSCFTSIFAEGQPAVIDARLANSSEDRLILSFKSLSLRQDAMPPRPDYGTKGWIFLTLLRSCSILCILRKTNQASYELLPSPRPKGTSP